jgi:hypothetical protein
MDSADPGPASVTCSGAFELALGPERAGELFTPEGERSWVEGWDPRYPDPDADRTAPGTVFVTDREGAEVVWVITARERAAMRYARFDQRGTFATVEVEWEPISERSTRVEVTYRSTAIRESGRAELARFAAAYDEHLRSWREAIEASLGA